MKKMARESCGRVPNPQNLHDPERGSREKGGGDRNDGDRAGRKGAERPAERPAGENGRAQMKAAPREAGHAEIGMGRHNEIGKGRHDEIESCLHAKRATQSQ